MKDKVLVFIIGLLLGAVITAACFLVYEKAYNNNVSMPNGERMEMMERPNGEEPPEMQNGEEPPEKPDGANDENRPEPPSKNNSTTETKAKETM